MADVSLNTHNPFRPPAATPNTTGSSYAPPPEPHPTTQQQRYEPPSTPRPEADPTGLSEEAPPAYTAGPDVYQGESTLEYGPSRPFQPVPPPLQHPQGGYAPPPQNAGWTPQQQAPSLWQQLTGQLTGANGSAPYQQSQSPSQFPPASWSAYPGGNAPPPHMHVRPPPQPPPPQPSTHGSDFARDFYATTSVPPGGFSDVSSARASGSGSGSEYPPPPPGPTRTPSQYRPPPGAPPPVAHTSSPGTSSAGGGGSASGIPDDGRPTRTPMPGHPLLRDGKMLVYPPHHECSKCNNTGYKHADPTHPCSKCWSKYAKPYSGALVYAPGTGPTFPAPGSQHASSSFQRPLPRIYAPPPSSPSSQLSMPNSSFAPPPGPAAGSQVYAPPPPPFNGYPGNAHQPNGYPGNAPTIVHTTGTMYPPPPHAPNANGYPPPAAVYPPGDPRLGGALCWRCSGRGTLSFLVFDTVPCSVCRGVGRVFG
ncbi:hypothetical protein C8R43DRAFT_691876 [Mycena crocata]|nr:hypothetical protein C8R43DRAFT_691876 [Mycena crocata]